MLSICMRGGTKHCIFTSPKPKDPPIGPMIGMTPPIGTARTPVGGVPMPSLRSMGMGLLFKGLFKGLGKAIGAIRNRIAVWRFLQSATIHGALAATSPSDVILAHELNHANNNANGEGMAALKDPDPAWNSAWTNHEEANTVAAENAYREQRGGVPQRPDYSVLP